MGFDVVLSLYVLLKSLILKVLPFTHLFWHSWGHAQHTYTQPPIEYRITFELLHSMHWKTRAWIFLFMSTTQYDSSSPSHIRMLTLPFVVTQWNVDRLRKLSPERKKRRNFRQIDTWGRKIFSGGRILCVNSQRLYRFLEPVKPGNGLTLSLPLLLLYRAGLIFLTVKHTFSSSKVDNQPTSAYKQESDSESVCRSLLGRPSGGFFLDWQ